MAKKSLESSTTMHSGSAEQPLPGRPRWLLHIQAQIWRILMGIGMILHRMAPPRPRSPNFTRTIPTTIAPRKGRITLHFYVPKDYNTHKNLRRRKYPVVVNFHGGGFTLGTATDDARWCQCVVDEVGAVVVSVGYRLAPENPFPTAVEDGCDAILFLALHADEYNLDVERIAVSGFSSGANMAFTVPLRLQEEVLQETMGDDNSSRSDAPSEAGSSSEHSPDLRASRQMPTEAIMQKAMNKAGALVSVQHEIKLKALISWYPPTDYTRTREERRATCSRTDHQLPAVFANLFDESYLQPPTLDMSNPYLSPGVAPDYMLQGLPDDIIMFTCEWDMLLDEGKKFHERLIGPELRKNVVYTMVPNVPHGWDKAPNPLKPTPGVHKYYVSACKELRRIFKVQDEFGFQRRESIVAFAAARRSIYEQREGIKEEGEPVGDDMV